MSVLEEFHDDFILLAEGGFIAVNQADEDSAVKLFRAAQLLRPQNALPMIGLGYLHLCKLELKQAVQHFQDALAQEPGNEVAKTLLGFSLSLTPHKLSEGEKVLAESEKSTKDPAIKQLAHDTIEFLEKYLKKAPSPAEIVAKPATKKPPKRLRK